MCVGVLICNFGILAASALYPSHCLVRKGLAVFNRYAHSAGPGPHGKSTHAEKSKFENRDSEHETLKFFFSEVDFPPLGSYFKSFAKMLETC